MFGLGLEVCGNGGFNGRKVKNLAVISVTLLSIVLIQYPSSASACMHVHTCRCTEHCFVLSYSRGQQFKCNHNSVLHLSDAMRVQVLRIIQNIFSYFSTKA